MAKEPNVRVVENGVFWRADRLSILEKQKRKNCPKLRTQRRDKIKEKDGLVPLFRDKKREHDTKWEGIAMGYDNDNKKTAGVWEDSRQKEIEGSEHLPPLLGPSHPHRRHPRICHI